MKIQKNILKQIFGEDHEELVLSKGYSILFSV